MKKLIPLAVRERARKYVATRFQVPEIPVALARLKRQGFSPEFIFDVGAYRGDFAKECLNVWDKTHVVCFEPQESILGELDTLSENSNSRITVFPYLIGSESRENTACYSVETASSVLLEHENQRHPVAFADMKTLAGVIDSKLNGRVPQLLKLDVQGYELEVLKGAEEYLDNIEVILSEVNLIDIHVGVPLMTELLIWLDQRGFVTFDICGLTRRPLDGALWQADLVFLKKDSVLRRDKSWQ